MRHSLRFWLAGLTAAAVLAGCQPKKEGPMMLADEAPPAAERSASRGDKPSPFPDEPAAAGMEGEGPAKAMIEDEADPSRKPAERDAKDKPQPLTTEPEPPKPARD